MRGNFSDVRNRFQEKHQRNKFVLLNVILCSWEETDIKFPTYFCKNKISYAKQKKTRKTQYVSSTARIV